MTKAAGCPADGRATSADLSSDAPTRAPAGTSRTLAKRGIHRTYLELVAEPGAVPYARRFTRHTLTAWQLARIADDAELVISELVTNAVRAVADMAERQHIALYIAADHDRLTLLVWDASLKPPIRQAHQQDSAGGRGLEIIDALSDRWGTWAPVQGGKVVWAWFDLDRS